MERDLAKLIRSLGDAMAGRITPGANEALLALVDDLQPDLAETMRRRMLQTAVLFGELNLNRFEEVMPKSATIHTDLRENVNGPVRGRDFVGLEGKDFAEIFRARITEWAALHSLQRAVTVSETIKQALRRVLVQGQEDGVGESMLATMIQREATHLSRTNAARIGRTEAHTAANLGSDEAARATGLTMIKEWASAEDSRVRESHAKADGDEVGLDEAFNVGGSALMFPGDPAGPPKEIINCRCTVLHHPIIGGQVIR